MIKIGEYQQLRVLRDMPQGIYLGDEEGNEVLMPFKFAEPGTGTGDMVDVFVYLDSKGRPLASNETPVITLGEFAPLQVVAATEIGAFCAWGVSKELLVPFSNLEFRPEVGTEIVVALYLDRKSNRLVGTTKLDSYLKLIADDQINTGDKVELLVRKESELGYNVIIDRTYVGLVYWNETPEPLKIGQTLPGYIKPIRPDGKIDVSLAPVGYQHIEPNAKRILEILERNNGFLPYTDKSDPEVIRQRFGISKKLFKKAIGGLYRQKLIQLEADGIHRTEK